MKHYTLISGTGRAGTTLLVRILTKAGLDTGFAPTTWWWDPVAYAGLETDIRNKPNQYIVKSTGVPIYIDQVLSSGDIAIDHAIICIRDIHDAAESRRRIQLLRDTDTNVRGGLWETSDPKDQERVLERLFYHLVFHLTKNDVPLVFLHFPRFATDPGYFVEKLRTVFGEIDTERLYSAHRSEVRPELITNFTQHSKDSTSAKSN